MYEPAQRGTILGIYYLSPLVGPSLGPLIGGGIAASRRDGWRDTLCVQSAARRASDPTSWFLAAYAGVVALVFVDQETSSPLTPTRRVDQVRVLVTVTRDGGEWRVSRMDAF